MTALTRNRFQSIAVAGMILGLLLESCVVCAASLAVSPPRDELSMIIASSTGNLAEVKHLLSRGMDPDHHDFTGNTPLLYAARYARVPLVEYLLRQGADVNARTHWGTTALIEAVRKGNLVVVQDLLDAGADVDQVDNRHESALFDAVKYRRLWAVNMLLVRNAKVDIKDNLGYTPLMYAAEEHLSGIAAALQRHSNLEALSGSVVPAAQVRAASKPVPQ